MNSLLRYQNLFVTLIITFSVIGSSVQPLFVKVTSDIVADNIFYVERLLVLTSMPKDGLCAIKCMTLTKTISSNLMKFFPSTGRCECMRASNQFKDSRSGAPHMNDAIFFVRGEFYKSRLGHLHHLDVIIHNSLEQKKEYLDTSKYSAKTVQALGDPQKKQI